MTYYAYGTDSWRGVHLPTFSHPTCSPHFFFFAIVSYRKDANDPNDLGVKTEKMGIMCVVMLHFASARQLLSNNFGILGTIGKPAMLL